MIIATENCIFCDIVNKKTRSDILLEDDNVIVIKDINPKAKTHLLIIPKLHVEGLLDLETKAKYDAWMNSVAMIGKVASYIGLKHWNTLINTGTQAGQRVNHLHIHMLSD